MSPVPTAPIPVPPSVPTQVPAVRPRRGVGVVAFIAAMLSLVIGGIAIAVAGYSIAFALRLSDYPGLVLDFEAQFWRTLSSAMWSVVWLLAAWIIHALLALWALIQGTVAAAIGRGRVWGVIAIVVSLTAWVPLAALTQAAVLGGISGLVPFIG